MLTWWEGNWGEQRGWTTNHAPFMGEPEQLFVNSICMDGSGEGIIGPDMPRAVFREIIPHFSSSQTAIPVIPRLGISGRHSGEPKQGDYWRAVSMIPMRRFAY